MVVFLDNFNIFSSKIIHFIYNFKKINGNQIKLGLLIFNFVAENFDLYVLTLLQYFSLNNHDNDNGLLNLIICSQISWENSQTFHSFRFIQFQLNRSSQNLSSKENTLWIVIEFYLAMDWHFFSPLLNLFAIGKFIFIFYVF